jgi:hypothetical protein
LRSAQLEKRRVSNRSYAETLVRGIHTLAAVAALDVLRIGWLRALLHDVVFRSAILARTRAAVLLSRLFAVAWTVSFFVAIGA